MPANLIDEIDLKNYLINTLWTLWTIGTGWFQNNIFTSHYTSTANNKSVGNKFHLLSTSILNAIHISRIEIDKIIIHKTRR